LRACLVVCSVGGDQHQTGSRVIVDGDIEPGRAELTAAGQWSIVSLRLAQILHPHVSQPEMCVCRPWIRNWHNLTWWWSK